MWIGILGALVLIGVAVLASENRRGIDLPLVARAFVLQVLIGVIVLYIPAGQQALGALAEGVQGIIGHAKAGADFLFGSLSRDGNLGFIFVVQVLPVIVFISALMSVLYYLNIMQRVVLVLGTALRWVVGSSRVVSLCAVANVFVGQTEAPLVVKPYLGRLSREQFFTVMCSGLASISGAILVGYSALGIELEYMIAASFMAAPGGLLMANLLVPVPKGDDSSDEAIRELNIYADGEKPANVFDAAAEGASTGVRLAVNIGAMLLAFIALISLANGLLSWLGSWVGLEGFTLDTIFSWVFAPLMYLMGVPWEEALAAGNLMGQKVVLNEFVAFVTMTEMQGDLSPQTLAISTFALCGFANLSSLAILIGGLGSLVPERRRDISTLGLKAVLAGSLSNLMSAAIAGLLLFGF
ncbi:MAG: NupC/NupG family nucleoside CNT transporter [Pseudomonadota bacterium]